MFRCVRTIGCLAAAVAGVGLGCVLYVDDACSDVSCGDNAYCEEGVCECIGGYFGDPELGCDAVQTWIVQDGCNDGVDVSWRLYAQGREWAWPSADSFTTAGFGTNSVEQIVCLPEDIVCFGAQAGETVWGVGVDGSLTCTDCCFECTSGILDYGILSCGS